MARSLRKMKTARARSRGGRGKKQASRKTKVTVKKQRLFGARTILERTLRVSYPAAGRRLVLRTEQDWNKDVEPVAVSEDGNNFTFQLQATQPFLYFKPCLVADGEFRWSVGPNKLLLMTEADRRVFYPFFFSA